jgi:hypothetical protein
MSEVHGGDTEPRPSHLLHRALLDCNVELLPILFAGEEQTVLTCSCVEAPRPVAALMELVSTDAFQGRDLLLKLGVLFSQPRYFCFSSFERFEFLRLDYVVAAANQRK